MADDSVPDDRGPSIIIVSWVEAGIAFSVVTLRLASRFRNNSLGWDDFWMLVALATFLAVAAVFTWSSTLGGFMHLAYLKENNFNFEKILFANYISQMITALSFAPPKTSVAMLVFRILQDVKSRRATWMKRLVWGILACLWVSTIVNIILIFAQCNPTRALWDTQLQNNKTCWSAEVEAHFAVFLSVVNIVCDLVLAFSPIVVIYDLQVESKKKVAFCLLMGYGVIAAAFAIVKTTQLAVLTDRADLTWHLYSLAAWSMSEAFVIIVCGSIPPVYLLFVQIWQRRVYRRGEQQAAMLHMRGDRFKAWAYADGHEPFGMNGESDGAQCECEWTSDHHLYGIPFHCPLHHDQNRNLDYNGRPRRSSSPCPATMALESLRGIAKPHRRHESISSLRQMPQAAHLANQRSISDQDILVSTEIQMRSSTKTGGEMTWR